MQTQGFSNLGQCLRDAVARERGGFMGLYTGYAATMVRDLPYFALQLGFYGKSSHSEKGVIAQREEEGGKK